MPAINYLAPDHPRPREVEWINRGTNQRMRPTTTQMLMRTLFQRIDTPSVQKLHDSAGLRVIFRSERDREIFAAAFDAALTKESEAKSHVVTAIFDTRDRAEDAVERLRSEGIPAEAISLLFRASQFMDTDTKWPDGHTPISVAGTVAGSGIAGMLVGAAILAVPGVGPVAAAGAIASSAYVSVASVSGIIGATGGAMAKMLTDHDVDGVSAAYYDQQIQRGKTFLSVDTRIAGGFAQTARDILAQCGGRTAETE
ncbi:hypothetical protein P7228_00035 [Altererythrobacter arenosus]|uniref:DUF1269 domain-containing protein n=1 Tax=Altererythrobacter arenosus TaxID=3032592 RepID=A0ABY8FR63_9SPHN|nr:hypothetical protein [Altererythrobacter sp. CAU 1644]WFL77490.1 hypothetical protein P7228_00035 [Altererythrobacter sp. CAU 1644]